MTARRVPDGLLECQSSEDLFTYGAAFLDNAGLDKHAIVFFDAPRSRADVCTSSVPELPSGISVALDEPWSTLTQSDRAQALTDSACRLPPHHEPVQGYYPLNGRTGAYGALVALEPVPDPTHDLLSGFAEQFGLMIPHVQLREELKRSHNADVAKLAMIAETRKVLRELDLDRVLAKFIELAMGAVSAEVGCIVLRVTDADASDGQTGEHIVEWGIDASLVEQFTHVGGGRLVDHVFDTRQAASYLQASDPPILIDNEVAAMTESIVALPLVSRDRCLGCFLAVNLGLADPDSIELLQALVDLSTTAVVNAMLHREALQKEALREQLRIAGDMQASLLPERAPTSDALDVAAENLPCDESGGDFYDFFDVDEHRLGFVIADATGHGIGAAIVATTTRAFIRALASSDDDPSTVLTRANDLLAADLRDDKFVTVFFGVADRRDGTLVYANAGHEPSLLVYRAGRDEFEWLECTGIPLGMFAGSPVDMAEADRLQSGDVMLLMSDGVHEAQNGTGEQFGKDRIFAVVREHSGQSSDHLVKQLFDAVATFCDGTAQDDDITIMGFRYT
ncbi:MAG: PP2C family protein-serine/threonine phosphatase [Pseudomonadota bacterium]